MKRDEFTASMLNKGFVLEGGEWVKRSRARVQHDNPRPDPKLERHLGDGALGPRQIQTFAPGKVLVRLTSFRSRLLDEDNLCEKYFVDCCRYAGILHADTPGAAKIEVRQEKAGKGEPEFVKLEIFQI